MAGPYGVYVHVPFCVHRCGYCDFVTYAGEARRRPAYVRAVRAEIARCPQAGGDAQTVYFGGGTPSFLASADLAAILAAVRTGFRVDPEAEVTFEANPSTAENRKLAELREAGFNRVSIGVQAFDDRILRSLDRVHTAADAEAAVPAARRAGFTNVSIDLMFGLPGQSEQDWACSLETAVGLAPEHLSLYALTVEEGTPFAALADAGRLPRPSDDAEAAMFETAIDTLTAAGYVQYEISNFALPGHEARHNARYWRNLEYLGFGPGAASYVSGRRWTNEPALEPYIAGALAGKDLGVDAEQLGPMDALAETMVLGLRLLEGVSLDRVSAAHAVDARRVFQPAISRLRETGLLRCEGDRLSLTRRGVMLANTVFVGLMDAAEEARGCVSRRGTSGTPAGVD